jgi:redox-sensitive bicupin YhaK (pirin superfamily)
VIAIGCYLVAGLAARTAILRGVNTVEIIHPRFVPLGTGDRMEVNRVLPQRALALIGGWCFLDHFGPGGQAMRVAGHPHTCLQTVTWLFSGAMRHRDSLGTDIIVEPGEVNLMTAGWGITHSEYSVSEEPLHGVQLWTALPDAARFTHPRFEHFATEPVRMADHEVAVFVGQFGDGDSPVEVYSPMVGAEVRFASSAELVVDVDPGWEFGVLADGGAVQVEDVEVPHGMLGYLAPGRHQLRLRTNADAGHVVRAIVIGGAPLDEEIVMWWNFVGRSHDEIAAWRANYQAGIGAEEGGDNPGNFPMVARTDGESWIPAPGLPGVRLKPRARRNR